MSELELKRTVTQEELDEAYAALPKFQSIEDTVSLHPSGDPIQEGEIKGPIHSVGVHVHQDRTVVVWLSPERTLLHVTPLNEGFDRADSLVTELGRVLEPVKGKKIPVYFTLTGSPCPMLFAELPKLSRPNQTKALRLQFRGQYGEEPEEIEILTLGNGKSGDKQHTYFALGNKKELLEKIVRPLKKQKFKVMAWDADLLCYVRAAEALWAKNNAGDGTRFLIILEWDHCILLVADKTRRIIAQRLSVGVQSFLKHLVSSREHQPQVAEIDSQDSHGRERRLQTNQAIHDIYIPFAQQIRTQLFAACSEKGMALPDHFALVASGGNLFQMVESLAYDLSLVPIRVEPSLPSESVGAFGAALFEEASLHVNILPRGRGEWVKSFREWWRATWSRVSPGAAIADAIPMNAGVLLGLPILILGIIIAVPVYQRYQVAAQLAQVKREAASMEEDKKRIAQGKLREDLYDKKMLLIKQIELKQWRISSALKELFSTIPTSIRLQSLAYKDGIFTLKGVTKEPTAVENFLKSALDLRLLVDPTPVDVHRDKKGTTFELTFRFRG